MPFCIFLLFLMLMQFVRTSWQYPDFLVLEGIQGIIPRGSIAAIHSARILDIRHSNITEIEDGALCASPSVQELTLYRNLIRTSLEPQMFGDDCRNLKKLVLYGNVHSHQSPVEDVISVSLPKLPDLETLEVFNAKMDKLEHVGGGNLKTLNVTSSGVESVKRNVLRGLKSLQVLDLSGNALKSFPWGDLGALERLKVLNVSDNKIQSINSGVLANMAALEVFSFKKNELSCRSNDDVIEELKDKVRIIESDKDWCNEEEYDDS